jgi:hypothetical protein
VSTWHEGTLGPPSNRRCSKVHTGTVQAQNRHDPSSVADSLAVRYICGPTRSLASEPHAFTP